MNIRLISPENTEIISKVAVLETQIFSDAWSENEVAGTVKQKQAFCGAAVSEGNVLGYFLCYYVLDECEIARIAVASDVRRQGIGDMLLRFMLQVCRKRELTKILLDVRAKNSGAIAFYKKNGFQKDGIRKGYYGMPEPDDAVLMSLDIPVLSTGNEG